MKLIKNSQSGIIAPVAVILLFAMLMLGVAAVNISTNTYSIVHRDNFDLHAQLASEAGLDDAIQSIIENPSWTAPTSQTMVMNTSGTRTTYELNVSDGSVSGEKIVRSTGRAFRSTSSSEAVSTRTYEVTLRERTSSPSGVPTSGSTVIAGPGGLLLDSRAEVRGSVYVGGSLTLDSRSKIIAGSNTVYVADNRCPVSGDLSTYPRICNTGETSQPITLTSNSSIEGRVMANNQTSTARMSGPGLVSGTVPAFKIPPPPNRAPIKSATEAGTIMTGAAASCDKSTVTWPANLKIVGNVEIDSGCIVTISGDTWITGNILIDSGSIVRIAEGLTRRPTIMLDGANGLILDSKSSILTNSNGVGGRFVTYYSTATCSPECTDVTGANLSASSKIKTIEFDSSAYSTLGSEFIAAWTAINIDSRSQVGALSGQYIRIESQATVSDTTYLTDSVYPEGGGPSGFSVHSYKRVF